MAKRKMPKGKLFEKGNPGGPGRPRMNEELKKIPNLNKAEVEKLLAKFSRLSIKEIEKISKDRTAPMLEMMVASVVLKAEQHGDQNRINWILDRTIGKVKEVKEIQLPVPTIIERPSGEIIELGAEMITDGDDGD